MNVIIVGGGQVGSYIANLLLNAGCHVRVIEKREYSLEKLRRKLPAEVIVEGGGSDPKTMEAAGIATADVLVSVTGEDEINLVASTIAKFEFGVPRVIARVNNPQNEWMFNASNGVDIKVNQSDILAKLVVEEIDIKNMITLFKLNHGNFSIIQMNANENSKAVSSKIKDLDVGGNAIFIAVHRGNDMILPHGDTIFEINDRVMAIVSKESEKSVTQLFD